MIHTKTTKIVLTALLAAMACVATMVIKIPIPATGGYINLGDCVVILSGILLGPIYGGAAAGIGSALADIFSGYVVFAPATFIIKALMALVVGIFIEKISKYNIAGVIISGVIAEIIMIVGYFLFEALFMGYGFAAAVAIPANAIQGAAGIVIATALFPILKRVTIFPHQTKHSDNK